MEWIKKIFGELIANVVKALSKSDKKAKAIQTKGSFLNKALSDKELEALAKIPPKPILFSMRAGAKIPPKPVLLSMMAGSFKAPISKIPTMLNASTQNLVYAFRAVVEKMEKEAPKPN